MPKSLPAGGLSAFVGLQELFFMLEMGFVFLQTFWASEA